MSTQTATNKSAAARFYEVFNRRDLGIAKAALGRQWAIHPAIPGEGSDISKYSPLVIALLAAFPDLETKIEKIIGEDDLVAVQITISGTHNGVWLGVPATGRRVSILAHDIHRIQDGVIAESWHVEDWLAGLFQMGAFK